MNGFTKDREDFQQISGQTDQKSGVEPIRKQPARVIPWTDNFASVPDIAAYFWKALDILSVQQEDISHSPYDIAVASLVAGPHQGACIRWLLQNRNTDGTWGAVAKLSWYDRYVCTYAAAVAFRNFELVELSDEILILLPDIPLEADITSPETLAFGGLVGALDDFSRLNNLAVFSHDSIVRHIVNEERNKWKMMLSWSGFYDPTLSITGYSGERIYGDSRVDLDRFLTGFQAENYSITTSPSASAMVLLEIERRNEGKFDERVHRLRDYVYSLDPYKRTIGHMDHISYFVTAWALMFISELNVPYHTGDYPALEGRIDSLYGSLFNADGFRLLSIAEPTTLPGDADSTASTVLGVKYARTEVFDISKLDHVYLPEKGYYETYQHERHPSLTTNIHMAGVLADLKAPQLDPLLRWLHKEVTENQNIICKWHVSPLYVMGEMARILGHIDHSVAQGLALHAGDYLLAKQKADGSWGFGPSTIEETGYAVLGLAAIFDHLYEQRSPEHAALLQILHDSLVHAKQYLQFISLRSPNWQNEEEYYPPLWIGKPLYTVRPLVPVLYYVSLGRIAQVEQNSQRLGILRQNTKSQRDRSTYIS